MVINDSIASGSPAPAPESSCGKENTLSGMGGLNQISVSKERVVLRRRRTELWWIKPLSPVLSKENSPGDQGIISGKKRRPYVRKAGKSRGSTCGSHGWISIRGRRREMEDAVTVELGFLKKGFKTLDFFGVYDGHGGSLVAHACQEMLHGLLVDVVAEERCGEIDWEKVMVASFRKMDEEVIKKGAALATMGSTAVVAVVGEEEVVVANCGDSRAVISRGGVPMQLSDDHKPDRVDELKRIEGCGGKVINWNGPRVLGVLATTRSIGDHYLKPFVISEPEVRVINRTNMDEFLILASDGLWDVISNDLACQLVNKCLDGQLRRRLQQLNINGTENSEGFIQHDERIRKSRAAEAAAVLAQLAMARGSGDNISVIVVDLRKNSDNTS